MRALIKHGTSISFSCLRLYQTTAGHEHQGGEKWEWVAEEKGRVNERNGSGITGQWLYDLMPNGSKIK